MELNSLDGKYYIHAIYTKNSSTAIHTWDSSIAYYMRASPDAPSTVYSQRINVGSTMIGKEAVFVSHSQSGTIGQANSFTGFQAYIIGQIQGYTAH